MNAVLAEIYFKIQPQLNEKTTVKFSFCTFVLLREKFPPEINVIFVNK